MLVRAQYPSLYRGFGATPQITNVGGTALNIAQIAQSDAPTGTKVLSSVGGGLLAAAPFTGPAAPFVAVAGLVVEFLSVMGVGSGCGQTCVLSSRYADQAEQLLQQNIATYFAQPVPRDPAAQAAALTIFDAIWSDLVQACGNAALGDAGKRCITDRQSGACVWRQTAESPYPGVPAVGECWNWISGYRDPIANDPNVSAGAQIFSDAPIFNTAGGVNWGALLIPALLVGAIWAVS